MPDTHEVIYELNGSASLTVDMSEDGDGSAFEKYRNGDRITESELNRIPESRHKLFSAVDTVVRTTTVDDLRAKVNQLKEQHAEIVTG